MYDAFSYPDHLTVTRVGEATQDPVTGILAPGQDEVVLTTRCDAQDDRVKIKTRPDASEVIEAGARVYVPDATDLAVLVSGDRVAVTQNLGRSGIGHTPITRAGEVVEVDVFNRALTIVWR